MKKQVVLIVDDDKSTRDGLSAALRDKYEVYLAESAERALEMLGETGIDAVLSDIRMPGLDGITLLHRALAHSPQPVCILMTAYGSIDRAVEAIKQGAADYITKPYNLDDLEMRLEKALRTRSMESENVRLQEELNSRFGLDGLVGNSEPFLRVLETIKQAAPTQATVLVQGESGTGKELVAHAIHRLSSRSRGPFVAVHCASLSQTLMESELFGHEKGSFTGAHERRLGRFEMADGGTLFLDEISEIDPVTQTKLLRVLEERCFERVGGTKTIQVDIRLIGATNRNLKHLVEAGKFRSDLFFRMNVVNLVLPPLREHASDVPLLCSHFLKQLSAEHGKPVTEISPEAMGMLTAYAWPGNVRELRNAIEKMVVLSKGPRLSARDLPVEIRETVGRRPAGESWTGTAGMPATMQEAEKAMIVASLKTHRGNRTKAATQLGISRRTFHRKLKEYQLDGTKPDVLP